MIVTVTPSPAIDWTIHVASFSLDSVNHITQGTRESSGKGLNVSWALHRAGISTVAVFPGGGTNGELMREELSRAGMPFVRVETHTNVRTNITLVSPGHSTKINEAGVALSPIQREHLVDRAVAASASADTALICGSLPTGTPNDYVRHLVERLAAVGVDVIVDSSGRPLERALDARPHLIKPNVHELATLVSRDLRSHGDVVDAARIAISRGAVAVLASLGADGAMYVDSDTALIATARDVPFVNSVGAGDALLAGYVSETAEAATRLKNAVLWASSAVAHESTLFPVRPEFAERISVHTVDAPDAILSEPSVRLS